MLVSFFQGICHAYNQEGSGGHSQLQVHKAFDQAFEDEADTNLIPNISLKEVNMTLFRKLFF